MIAFAAGMQSGADRSNPLPRVGDTLDPYPANCTIDWLGSAADNAPTLFRGC